MHILKRLLIAVALLIAAPFVVALFVKKDFDVTRTVVIDRPRADVFAYTRLVKNQLAYATWFKQDPAMKTSFRGTDGAVGFVMAWESANSNVGKGEQEIKRVVEPERIDVEIRFSAPFVATNPAETLFEAVDPGHTRVTNVYHGHMDYPGNLLCSAVAEKIGQDMGQNLSTLKSILEKR